MKAQRASVSFILALLVILAAFAPPAARAEIVFRAGHALSPDHPYQLGLARFAELVKTKTGGEVLIEIFPNSQLGSERELVENIQLGAVDICVVSSAPLSGFTKSMMAFDLPYIFPTAQKARQILDGPIGQKSLGALSAINLVGLAYFENGFSQISNTERPILKPGDAQGLKIRCMENKIHLAALRAVGASPVPMAFAVLFDAMRQGDVDGQDNPLATVLTGRYYDEAQGYLSLSSHFYMAAPLMIGRPSWEKLTPKQQDALSEAALEARDYERAEVGRQESAALGELAAKGLKISKVDRKLWREAMSVVYKDFENEIGADVIKAIQAAVGN